MCVIIAKTKKGHTPTIQQLRNCYNNNPDGAGFMYTYKGKVIIDKGYMTIDHFIERYKDLLQRFDNFKDKALVIHCRIGTSGRNDKGNTHPFIISAKTKELKKTINTASVGVVHNGIIHDYEPKNQQENISDTMLFIKKYLTPLYNNYKGFYTNKDIMRGIETITGSKWAILDTNDNVYMVGDFIKYDGVYYSNDSYKMRQYNWGWYRDDNHYDDYYDNNYKLDYKSVKDYDIDLKYDDYYELDGELYQVRDRHIKYNTLTCELFKADYLGNYHKIDDNAICYNSDFEIL